VRYKGFELNPEESVRGLLGLHIQLVNLLFKKGIIANDEVGGLFAVQPETQSMVDQALAQAEEQKLQEIKEEDPASYKEVLDIQKRYDSLE
jgi:hypothetical protein